GSERVASPNGAAAAGGGVARVTGRVFNPLSDTYVPNARVVVEGTSLEALTDSGGAFILEGVPAGDVRIRASYVGLQAETQVVRLAPGATVLPDFNLGRLRAPDGREDVVIQLGKITVVADEEMSA